MDRWKQELMVTAETGQQGTAALRSFGVTIFMLVACLFEQLRLPIGGALYRLHTHAVPGAFAVMATPLDLRNRRREAQASCLSFIYLRKMHGNC